MNCLRCEVTRAKLLAGFMWALGKTPDAIAAHLTEAFGVKYFVDKGAIWRTNNPANIRISGVTL